MARKRQSVMVTVNLHTGDEVAIAVDQYKPLEDIMAAIEALYPTTSSVVMTIVLQPMPIIPTGR